MEEFFASIYEWFGLMPLYSTDMADLLRGWDITCTDYIGTPWYNVIGVLMIFITILSYGLQYHAIDNSKFNKKQHWWLMAFLIVGINFLIAFINTFVVVSTADYCMQLNLKVSDCLGFGFSNAIWSLILFMLLTSFKYPRQLSNNCRYTTFWKP